MEEFQMLLFSFAVNWDESIPDANQFQFDSDQFNGTSSYSIQFNSHNQFKSIILKREWKKLDCIPIYIDIQGVWFN